MITCKVARAHPRPEGAGVVVGAYTRGWLCCRGCVWWSICQWLWLAHSRRENTVIPEVIRGAGLDSTKMKCPIIKLNFQCYTQIFVSYVFDEMYFSALAYITSLCLIYMETKTTKLCSYILKLKSQIGETLKLVLSLFNGTFRQNPNKPFEIWFSVEVCMLQSLFESLRLL